MSAPPAPRDCRRFRVVGLHALRNALIPVVTVIGLQIGTLLAGAVLTETIFSWPGVGKWLIEVDRPARLSGPAGRHHADLRRRDRRQSDRRHALRPHQPADPPCPLTSPSHDAPVRRAGASRPAAVDFWRSFRENRGAVVGLDRHRSSCSSRYLRRFVAPHRPIEQFRGFTKLPPVWDDGGDARFMLGTDALGRDMLSRLIYGARISLFIGLSVMVVSTVVGVALGLVAHAFGGIVDVVILRMMDLIVSIPSLVLAILIIAVIGPNLTNTIVAVTIVYLPRYVRLVRASALTELTKDYVTAARGRRRRPLAADARDRPAQLPGAADRPGGARRIRCDPGGRRPGLSRPRRASRRRRNGARCWPTAADLILSQPWVVTFPGLAILITVLAINLMGDGLRDALDPRLKRS